EVAVAGAFDDEAQGVLAREVDPGDDIRRVARFQRVDARARRPDIEPTRYLGAGGQIADEKGIVDVGGNLHAGRSTRLLLTGREQGVHRDQIAAHGVVELLPAGLRRPARIAWAHACEVRARPWRRAGSRRPGSAFLRRRLR